MQNPMQIIQMLNQIRGSGNPMAMMQSMFGNNPAFSRAVEMTKGKNPQQIEQVVRNLAKEKGVDFSQLQQMASMFGIKL